jgi:hypothetical protein
MAALCFGPQSSAPLLTIELANTPAVANLTCLAMKRLRPPRDETDEISGLARAFATAGTMSKTK